MKPSDMADINTGVTQRLKSKVNQLAKKGSALPITYKLIASFLLISILSNIFFTIAGITFIGNRIITEAQERVRNDLNSAREIYLGELRHISDIVRLTSRRPIVQDLLT